MFSRSYQTELVDRLLGRPRMHTITDSLDVHKAFAGAPPREGNADAVAMFVDIAGFSARVRGWNPPQVREYLERFYKGAIPIIDQRKGMIDRIAGDGILAVFSSFLSPGLQIGQATANALSAAEEIIKMFSGTAWATKAALSSGTLLFCKAGVDGLYSDYTAIGNLLTHVYRMEEIACVDQIVAPRGSTVGPLLQPASTGQSLYAGLVPWTVEEKRPTLRGAEDLGALLVRTYRRRA